MKNADQWRPGKYVVRGGRLRGSRDPRELRVGSRLVTDLVASQLERYLTVHARGHLIDLGCGKVPLFGFYRDLVESTTCVDWDNSLHRNEFLDCSCNLNEPLPFMSQRFDTILFSDVLEHLPDPSAIWRELARILAPGGKLLLSTPFYYWLHEVPHDYFRYTEYALNHYAQQQGLEVLVLTPLGGSVDVLADMCAKQIEIMPLLGNPLARLIQGSAALFGSTPWGAKVRHLTASRFPLGYFLVARKPSAPA